MSDCGVCWRMEPGNRCDACGRREPVLRQRRVSVARGMLHHCWECGNPVEGEVNICGSCAGLSADEASTRD